MERLRLYATMVIQWAGRRLSESATEFLAYVVIIAALLLAAKLGVLEAFLEWLSNSGGGEGGGGSS